MEKKYFYGLIANALITIFAIIAFVSGMIKYGFNINWLSWLVIYAIVLYYTVVGYKKPHGNLLKYLMLAFVLVLTVGVKIETQLGNFKDAMIIALTMAIVAYIAGRLNKIQENKYLTVIALLLLCHAHIGVFFKVPVTDFITFIEIISPIIIWLDICGAYFTRYAAHKEAGLQ